MSGNPISFATRNASARSSIGSSVPGSVGTFTFFASARAATLSPINFNNSGRGGQAGSIVAALFLDYFVPQDIAWAHFDVFSWNDVSRPGRPAGGEAQGLRAVLAALQ